MPDRLTDHSLEAPGIGDRNFYLIINSIFHIYLLQFMCSVKLTNGILQSVFISRTEKSSGFYIFTFLLLSLFLVHSEVLFLFEYQVVLI